MAIRTILFRGDETLLKKSRAVTNYDTRLWELLDDMAETLQEAGGVGLAAPQVGVLRRAVLVEDEEGKVIELVNPRVLSTEGEQEGGEGCLSVPGLYGVVKRPMVVTVSAHDRHGKSFEVTGEGNVARCFCHEIDHLDGVLFTKHVIQYIDPEKEEETQAEEEEVR